MSVMSNQGAIREDVLSWPFVDIDFTLDAFPWQKQEAFKGVNAAGSLSAGWGFHCWVTNINGETVWRKYSATGANALVENGSIITNAVFDRGISEMFASTISDYDKADILAFHIPAVSSPAGKVAIIGSNQGVEHDFNLNREIYRSEGWGRDAIKIANSEDVTTDETTTEYPWLHSDMKDVSYFYNFMFYCKLKTKGNIQ